MMKEMIVGIGFYRREQWPLLRESAVDAHLLEENYDDWIGVVDTAVTKIRERGLEPKLVDLDVRDLLAYCRRHGIPNNAGARAQYLASLSSDPDRE